MNNRTHVTRLEAESLYKIMVKRIAKGYSPQDLSFLCGQDPTFIHDAECLEAAFYSDQQLEKIAAALEEDNVDDLLADVADGEEYVEIEMQRYQDEETQYTSYTYINKAYEERMLFQLKEEMVPFNREDVLVKESIDTIKGLLKVMADADYFYQNRSTLEIYNAVKPILSLSFLKPEFLYVALEEFELPGPVQVYRNMVYDEFAFTYEAQ